MKNESKKENDRIIDSNVSFWLSISIVILVCFGLLYLRSLIDKDEEFQYVDNTNNITNEGVAENNTALKGRDTNKDILGDVNKYQLELKYRSDINNIIESYDKIKDSGNRIELAKFTNKSLDALFNMIVPKKYKEFHLKIVLSISAVNKDITSNNDVDYDQLIELLDSVIVDWK